MTRWERTALTHIGGTTAPLRLEQALVVALEPAPRVPPFGTPQERAMAATPGAGTGHPATAEWSKLVLHEGVAQPPAYIPDALSDWMERQLRGTGRIMGSQAMELYDPGANGDAEPDLVELGRVLDAMAPADRVESLRALRMVVGAFGGEVIHQQALAPQGTSAADAEKTARRLAQLGELTGMEQEPQGRVLLDDLAAVRRAVADQDAIARFQLQERVRQAQARGWRHPVGPGDGTVTLKF